MRDTHRSSRATPRPAIPTRSAILACALLAIIAVPSPAQQIDQAVGELTGQILDSLQAEGKTKVAVVELTDLAGEVTPLGRLVAEELLGQLFAQGGEQLQLVERSKLEEVLGEQRLGIKGLLEKENVETFGRVLGVEAILTGTIAVLQDRVRINARLIAVPSAELFATAATYMSRLGLDESYFEPETAEAPAGGSGGDAGSAGSPGPVATKEYQGIGYELIGCTQATRLITCEMVLTNNRADREYWIELGESFLYDQRGYQFYVSRIRLGDVDTEGSYAEKLLITEIPTETDLFFEGVPSSIEFIKILHLSTDDGEIEFRDIHFTED